MINSVHIEGYRGFQKFEMVGLGRVNLLVGTNNSGKTSVLEAIHLLAAMGDPLSLWQLLFRRGERSLVAPSPDRPIRRVQQMELDVCHLFTGHDVHHGSKISISARNQTPERSLTFAVSELTTKERVELLGQSDEEEIPSRLVLQIKGSPRPIVSALPLSRSGGLLSETLDASPRRLRQRANVEIPSHFITTESFTGDQLVALWNGVALTPSETLVLRALQFLDPKIEAIAAQVSNQAFYGTQSRGGFIIRRKGYQSPIPIGSMGDGMWRMLAMAIALTQCQNGILLVDEIDTGLHYTVMSQMWKLIFNTARELNVQVFATTHSYDCIYSLAQMCPVTDSKNQVAVHRIEPNKSRSIPYDEQEISVAAAREIEVR